MVDVKSILTNRLEVVRRRITDNLAHRRASGRTAASLKVEVTESEGVLLADSSLLTLERGRGPGRVPHNFTAIIKEWIQAKGISVTAKTPSASPEAALNSMAGAIAYNIIRRGTTQFQTGRFDDIYSTVIEEETQTLSNEVSEYIALEIEKANENFKATNENG